MNDEKRPRVILCREEDREAAVAIMREYDRCVCGLTRRQHDEQWPACPGFRPAGG